jgi:8-oxo-dGTP pyrophosphatase MutT (NUDIX family)
MVRTERSAGFVVFAQEDVAKPREFLLLDYGRHWDYPKGHVESAEDDLAAAYRELREETGLTELQVERIHGFEHEIAYTFRSNRFGQVRKTVRYFLARTATRQIQISDEHQSFIFLPFDQAVEKLTFETAKSVLRRANVWLG